MGTDISHADHRVGTQAVVREIFCANKRAGNGAKLSYHTALPSFQCQKWKLQFSVSVDIAVRIDLMTWGTGSYVTVRKEHKWSLD
ncbi:hypothetical protein KIN20_028349 [Parelaphostrongylus tenuis]|uniref:Uncharacterized protein n=1 Tax=Parelaphostrongylus tenuis TaxID=148309 RepID=A0AAD5R1G4_PARTN|nr:hypothetical protein KIN20_028349 [Parelaphostrongylus tenuis]